ncbi:curli-like amyloid fiber formation chaperone CsgH [Maricaulis sp.]|uniref:curli-like amyloid fiber formation chaperone CsgH n=1 Tax=Maricaulis sp. TaxID=1486257 RepID=UPI001B23C2E0|nr:curli-like amyloid fiber formation chaperone CsgH [Maricaulis sp.]MBO6764775.1 hypothetical protein [Maricaulis sp.]
MTGKLAILASAASAAGLWFVAQADPLPDLVSDHIRGGEAACGIDVSQTSDGLLLTAWSAPSRTRTWRMVVTQRTGGGGFDIVQEGDVPPGDGAVAVSDLLIDTGADFSARLTAWDANGDPVCRFGDRI